MTIKHAYSVLTVKAMDEETRTIRGVATTPAPDRVDDIVVPTGAKFTLPLPLLWQHRSDKPIGHVTEATVTDKGIEIVAQIAKGVTADIEEAWALIKAGLVRGLSIGFRGLEVQDIVGSWGVKFTSWEWLELSAVTIPANAEASIQSVKQFAQAPATTGTASANPPGASGKTKTIQPVSTAPTKEGNMKTIAERIAALESTRSAKAAKMDTIMAKSADENRSTDAAEQEEFDNLASEVEQLDGDIKRLKTLEAAQARSATTVVTAPQQRAATAVRGGEAPAAVVLKQKTAAGVRFARVAKARAVSRLDSRDALTVAKEMYGEDSETAHIIKAAVTAGSTVDGNWASALVGDETNAFADFISFLRPATILGKFGQDGIPALRGVPFREPLIAQTGGGAGYWVGEGKPKPLTSFNFTRTHIEPLKVANIAVLTEENVRSSNPSSELIVRDALRDALVETQDLAFIDPTNAGVANVKPASILNGAEVIASSGTDADAIRADVRAVFQKFILASNAPQSGVWIMSATTALALSLMMNPLGQREFPGISMGGGTFEGLPVIVSQYAGTNVALVNAADIYEADEGGIAVDMSREASLEMKDSGLTQDGTAGTGTSLVSLWQSNLVGLRAERIINWMRRRVSAVAYISGVAWGGPVAAS